MRVALAAVGVAVLLTAGCDRQQGGSRPAGTVRVLAAASLSGVAEALVREFRSHQPKVSVDLQFGASSALARQVADGAPADVLVTADRAAMEAAGDHVGPPVRFAGNRLAIVVEPGNPHGVSSLRDLADGGVTVVLCAPSVPCGRLARTAAGREGVDLQPASLEEDVRAVVSKVALGEADAGIAYITDVRAAGGAVEGIDLPEAADLQAEYLAAAVDGASRSAAAWVTFLRSPSAAAVLRAHGFVVS